MTVLPLAEVVKPVGRSGRSGTRWAYSSQTSAVAPSFTWWPVTSERQIRGCPYHPMAAMSTLQSRTAATHEELREWTLKNRQL